jgi:hypothetical protein
VEHRQRTSKTGEKLLTDVEVLEDNAANAVHTLGGMIGVVVSDGGLGGTSDGGKKMGGGETNLERRLVACAVVTSREEMV